LARRCENELSRSQDGARPADDLNQRSREVRRIPYRVRPKVDSKSGLSKVGRSARAS
jgi:hypothetical protein